MCNSIKEKVRENIDKQKDTSTLDKDSRETLIENEYIKALENIKRRLLDNGKFQNYDKTVINYDRSNFNSLLTVNLNGDCNGNFMYYVIYICDFIYKILCNVSILHYTKMAVFAKLNDSLETDECFV